MIDQFCILVRCNFLSDMYSCPFFNLYRDLRDRVVDGGFIRLAYGMN